MSEFVCWFGTDLDDPILWIYLMMWLVQSIILINAKYIFLFISFHLGLLLFCLFDCRKMCCHRTARPISWHRHAFHLWLIHSTLCVRILNSNINLCYAINILWWEIKWNQTNYVYYFLKPCHLSPWNFCSKLPTWVGWTHFTCKCTLWRLNGVTVPMKREQFQSHWYYKQWLNLTCTALA